jgi:enoyl-CoA hydratase/carnithine racemase
VTEEDIVVTRRGRAHAVVTINRPDTRNALSLDVQDALTRALDDLAGDAGIRAVVFTGSGERAFIAGADVKQLRDYTLHDGLSGRLQRLFDLIAAFEKPTIAAVNGLALGGGCEFTLACDIRIAAQSARFGFPETGLAIIPGAGGTQRLPQLIGAGRALELILTGRIISAEEALAMGLVSHVVPDADLLTEAETVAESVASKGPLATQLARLVVRSGTDAGSAAGMTLERMAQAILHGTADKQEGITALLEKRPPDFEGH